MGLLLISGAVALLALALYAYVVGELIRGWPKHPDSRCYTGLTNRSWAKHQDGHEADHG